MRDLGFRQIRYVVELARLRSYHKAAEKLCISQPALTKSIQNFERILGIPLFVRSSKGVVPTLFCESILDRAEDIFGILDAMVSDIELKLAQTNGIAVVDQVEKFAFSYEPEISHNV